jgi:hypothetical protein
MVATFVCACSIYGSNLSCEHAHTGNRPTDLCVLLCGAMLSQHSFTKQDTENLGQEFFHLGTVFDAAISWSVMCLR